MRYYRYRLPPAMRRFIDICEQFMIPLACFQLIRTLFLPTTFDVIILCGFGIIIVAFKLKWI